MYPSQEEYERLGTDAYAVLAGDKAYRTEMLMRRKDGTNVTISLSGKAIDATRPQAGSIWIFEDNTERINARLQLQEKNRQLEFLTGDLEKKVEKEVALRAKGEQILFQQSKLAAMGEMLGAISHQWRQPLNALGIIIQNIRESVSAKQSTLRRQKQICPVPDLRSRAIAPHNPQETKPVATCRIYIAGMHTAPVY